MTYKPNPIDVSHIDLHKSVEDLIEILSKHVHDVWAQQRIKEGWKWGPERNDNSRQHPALVPYEDLPETEKDYDRTVVTMVLKAVSAVGYRIEKN